MKSKKKVRVKEELNGQDKAGKKMQTKTVKNIGGSKKSIKKMEAEDDSQVKTNSKSLSKVEKIQISNIHKISSISKLETGRQDLENDPSVS